MSYILDALRKADAERERDPARGIHAQPGSPVSAHAGPRVPRWTWPAVAGAAVLVAGGYGAWVAQPAPRAIPSVPAGGFVMEPPKAPPVAACRLTGAPARLAEKASKDIPLEILVASGERARLGFATSSKEAQGVAIDLTSLQVTPEFAKPPRERLRAVLPFGEDSAEYVTQLESHNDKVKAWRTISTAGRSKSCTVSLNSAACSTS